MSVSRVKLTCSNKLEKFLFSFFYVSLYIHNNALMYVDTFVHKNNVLNHNNYNKGVHMFEHTILREGGFTQDKNDKGNWTSGVIGEGVLRGTKYGISAAAYPHIDIKSLTKDVAKTIYRADYWDANDLNDYEPKLAGLWFDMAVNHGRRNAAKIIQTALGVTADGIVGRQTKAALAKQDTDFFSRVYNERILFYTKIRTFDRYGKGWIRRACSIYSHICQSSDA